MIAWVPYLKNNSNFFHEEINSSSFYNASLSLCFLDVLRSIILKKIAIEYYSYSFQEYFMIHTERNNVLQLLWLYPLHPTMFGSR